MAESREGVGQETEKGVGRQRMGGAGWLGRRGKRPQHLDCMEGGREGDDGGLPIYKECWGWNRGRDYRLHVCRGDVWEE